MKTFFAGMLTLGLSSTALAQEECSGLMDSVTQISIALDEALLDKAAEVAEKARQELMCQQSPVNNLVLTQLYHFSEYRFVDRPQAQIPHLK